MAEATTGDGTLTSDDAAGMLDELLEAQNQSRIFGLKLNLPLHIVDAIHSTYSQPKDRLLQVLIEFTKQTDPRPTWRVIAYALRSPAVNLPHLAEKVEAAHFPDPTSTRDVVPDSALATFTATQSETITDVSCDGSTSQKNPVPPSTAAVQSTTTSLPPQLTPTTGDILPTTETMPSPSPEPGPGSSQCVKAKSTALDNRFYNLKNRVRECLEKRGITVKRVADALTSLSADDMAENKQFLKSHFSDLFRAANLSELFGTMNFNWNYLSYHLLDYLIQRFELEEIKGEMATYKEDLRQFREQTPLTLFCLAHKKRRQRIDPEFREMVAEFNWPNDVTLEVVEQFRQEYACHYNLQECAMMLAEVRPGSFVVTWFIPESIVEKLKANLPRLVCKKYSVTELAIAGRCVYRLHKHQVTETDVLLDTKAKQQLRELELSNTREVDDLNGQLQCSVALVAGLQETIQQRDSELMSKDMELEQVHQQLMQQDMELEHQQLIPQVSESHEMVQAKTTELALVQQRLIQLEQSSKMEIDDLKEQLQSSVVLVADLWNNLQQRDSELRTQSAKNLELTVHKAEINAELKKQLMWMEAELTLAGETIRRLEQQLTLEIEGRRKQKPIQGTKEMVMKLQPQTPHFIATSPSALVSPSHSDIVPQPPYQHYACQVSGPGLQSATVNHPTHILVELRDSSGKLCSLQQNVTAELELVSEASKTFSSGKMYLEADSILPSQYKVSYTAVSRGQHKLHVRVNNKEIKGSPFTMTVYPDPTQLKDPVSIVTGLNRPYGIAVNSRGEMIVSECDGHRISIWKEGEMIQTYGSHGDSPQQMIEPAGIAVDNKDNIYVSSEHKLQKFCSNGEFKYVGNKGSGDKEFNDPRGVTLYNNRVYVCDRNNDRIQVFDLDLNFVESIISRGKGRCEFNAPFDIQFDGAGNMYIAEYCNKRVQVMDSNGCYLREFGQEVLRGPSALHIVDRFVYVSDFNGHCIVVYETSGLFVTKFGKLGHEKVEFGTPYCITSCVNGHIYVCDWANKRVQIF